jgi:hypothetical protein
MWKGTGRNGRRKNIGIGKVSKAAEAMTGIDMMTIEAMTIIDKLAWSDPGSNRYGINWAQNEYHMEKSIFQGLFYWHAFNPDDAECR